MNSDERRPIILIVDDTQNNIEALLAILGQHYDLRVAVDGETALRTIEEGLHPDLVLLDIMMPGIDGYEVCRRLKEDPRTSGTGVILLTALSNTSEQEKGLRLGADDFIVKPFEPAILLARVRTQLELKSYRDKLEQQVIQRTEQLTHAQEATIASMAIMAEYRDPETGNHILRTQNYVAVLARCLARKNSQFIAADQIDLITRAAPLHDIGKVAIADPILLKPGRLTVDEFNEMKQHTIIGSEAIRRTEAVHGSTPLLRMAAEIAEFHHEKWDGSGYPHGRSKRSIPLSARLMTIADVYDALTSERPYKQPFSHEQAVAIILEGDGYTRPSDFDPQLLDCFRRIEPEFRDISIRLSD